MTSIQEALTEALEHPVTEPRGRTRPQRKSKTPQPRARTSAEASALLWGVLGSAAAALLALGVYTRFIKPTR